MEYYGPALKEKATGSPIGPTLEEVQGLLKGTALKLGFEYEPKVSNEPDNEKFLIVQQIHEIRKMLKSK